MRTFTLILLFVLASSPLYAQAITCWGIQGYVADPREVFTFPSDDPASITVIGTTQTSGVTFEGLEFHPNGNLYAHGRHSDPAQTGLYLVDQMTGAVTYIGGGDTDGEWVRGLAYDPSTGQMLAITRDGASSSVYEIDVVTGLPTLLETTADLVRGDGIGIDTAGQRILLDASENRVFRGCPPSGYAPLGPVGLNLYFESGLTVDWSRDSSIYVASWQFAGSSLYLVDPNDGTTTSLGLIGGSSAGQFFPTDVAFPIAAGSGPAIPEPDCNSNGIPDHCEIATGAVTDLDSNGVPDACDIAAGASDCDANGILDSADRVETSLYIPGSGIRMTVGDVNVDGFPDILLSDVFDDEIVSLLNDGTGHFTAGPILSHPTPVRIALDDIDGDGANDLVIEEPTQIVLRFNDGFGGFSPPQTAVAQDGDFSLADLNSDGLSDLLVVNDSTELLHINIATAPGVFSTTTVPLLAGFVRSSHVGDFNNDGNLDFLVIDANFGPYLYPGTGTGSFLPPINLEAFPRYECGVMDLNGDGTLDLIERSRLSQGNEFRVYLGDGTGDFTLAWTEPAASQPWTAQGWDASGNGLTSVVFTEEDSRFLTVYRWEAGQLVPYQVFSLHRNVGRINFSLEDRELIAVEDFDGDGLDDLAITIIAQGSVSVLLQREPDCNRNGLIDPCDFATGGDTNGNGILDDCEAINFLRGDVNADTLVDIADSIELLGKLFSGTGPASCQAATDTNFDAAIDIADVIYLLGYLFSSGAAPPPPFPVCGSSFDPGDAALGCSAPGC